MCRDGEFFSFTNGTSLYINNTTFIVTLLSGEWVIGRVIQSTKSACLYLMSFVDAIKINGRKQKQEKINEQCLNGH